MNPPGLLSRPVEADHAWDDYQGRGYFPELDGLRAVSIVVVVAHHMHDEIWKWLNGPLGVTIFFVVSGYLITTLAVREERRQGRFSLAAFYIRRAFRIFPSYYLTLGLYCLMIFGLGLLPRARQGMLDALPYYLTYLPEVPVFFRSDSAPIAPFRQSWSLGIEEKFYLVWPILIFGLWESRPKARVIGTTLLSIAFAATPALTLIGREGLGMALMPYSSILFGCLVALMLDDRAWFARLSWLGRRPVASLLLATMFTLHGTISPSQGASHAAYAITVAAFLASLLIAGGPIRKALSWRPLVKLGRLSYGIYLLHYFAIYAAQLIARPGTGRVEVGVLAFALTMVIASALAYGLAIVVERPFIALGRKWSSSILRTDGVPSSVGI